MTIKNFERAEVLTQALPYIQKYYNKVVVIKYGGNAMINESLKQQVMEDIILLSLVGVKVVMLHGGGPEITGMLTKLGKESTFVNGLRVTDAETMEITQMVLSGKVNKSLVNLIQSKGGKAMGISGVDGKMIVASQKEKELGFVGTIESVNIEPIISLLDNGYIPVVSTIGCDEKGNTYNINADTAAAFIAGALNAENLMLMTDIAGILTDKDDPSTLISEITVAEANNMIAAGTINGGMIPKVECCTEAIEKGVEKVVIMDGRIPHSLLIEILTDEGAGTMMLK